MRLTKSNIISNSKVYERKYNVTYDLYAFIFAFYILNLYFFSTPNFKHIFLRVCKKKNLLIKKYENRVANN